MTFAIQSSGLSRAFGPVNAVQGLNLEVPEGTISAFLGPNGAGKSTTIRLLLGLLKPQSGTCEILGLKPGDPSALAQVGAMVESPSLYGHLTGTENINITRLMRQLSPSETDRVLSLVGLKGAADRLAQTYSTGMRQRLGIALALLGTPRLVILDEPTNGLDPAGIQEMRELILRLPRETGATIFVSSHILAEVEQVAEHLVIINRGQMKYQGTLEQLRHQGPSKVYLRVEDRTKAMQHLTGKGVAVEESREGLLIEMPESSIPSMVQDLAREGFGISEVSPIRINLESRFMALMEEAS